MKIELDINLTPSILGDSPKTRGNRFLERHRWITNADDGSMQIIETPAFSSASPAGPSQSRFSAASMKMVSPVKNLRPL